MRHLSFNEFLRLYEDVAADIANLQRQIADIDVKIQRQAKPLQDQRTRLNQMLAQKYKQRQAELAREKTQQEPGQTDQNQQMVAKQQ